MQKKEAWVISVDMGYGHQRAAYPLKDIAYERIITANSDKIISEKERRIWHRLKVIYETLSRIKQFPIIGKILFGIYDHFQNISPFFPFRDLSKPTFPVIYFWKLIKKKGLCKSLIDYVQNKDIPFITTHFIPALAADYHGLKKIYCIVTDTDINRVWVSYHPKKSNITYLAPCRHTAFRLKEYGVSDDRIILTGFPLPKENLGNNREILRRDLAERIINLDPKKAYSNKHIGEIKKEFGKYLKNKPSRHLTITYAVGGAGAEKEIGIKIISSLKSRIKKQTVNVNLSAGTRLGVKNYFEEEIKKIGMNKHLGKEIKIIFSLDKKGYFSAFNDALHTTDILWTKPSELSFYTALGLPIIMAPPVGSHEKFNLQWLEHIGSGFIQENPEFVNDWLYYWLEDGRLAEAAFQGFLDAHYKGTERIERIVQNMKKIK